MGTGGGFVQVAGGEIGLQQCFALGLQGLVFLSGTVHGGLHISTLGKNSLGGCGHGLAQLHIDLPQLGYFFIGPGQTGSVLGFPVGSSLSQDGSRADHRVFTVSHMSVLLQDLGNGFQLCLSKLAGGALGHGALAVALLDFL